MTSLYDFMIMNGHEEGCDCYDNEYEMPGICMIPIPDDEVNDYYDVISNWILKSTELVSYDRHKPEYSTIGDFAQLVRDNINEFRIFTAKCNDDRYIVEGLDDDSLYNGVCTIHSLSAGYYAEEDYAYLAKLLRIPKHNWRY